VSIFLFILGKLVRLMTFPAHYPDECPPGDARDADGELFRFVRNQPPQSSDFVPVYPGNTVIDADMRCQACGLSVLLTEVDVVAARKTCPWFKKRLVAKGRVNRDWGKTGRTGSQVPNHYTWWVASGKSPEQIFEVIEVR